MTDTPDPDAIDWAEIHQRVAAAQTASRAVSPEVQKQTFHARALALAQTPEAGDAEGTTLEVIEFLLAHERYGLESRYVREVYPLRELTPLPGTPPFLLGLVNVRGQILSVIDLKKFFDLPDRGLTDLNKIIILDSGDMRFGVLADVIFGVRRIAVSDLQPALPTQTGLRAEFLRGVTPEHVVILAAEKLLTSRDLIIHEDVDV